MGLPSVPARWFGICVFRDTPAVESLQLRVLDALESAHNYNRWIAELIAPYLGDDPLEIGSGIGVSASLWLSAGVQKITVTEMDDDSLRRLQDRFARDGRVDVAALDLADASPASYSAVVALNVLEHIEHDQDALRKAGTLVRPGGRVIVFVPAFPFAAGRFDRLIGHYRRYTAHTIASVMTAAGLELETVEYVNAPGLLVWFVAIRLLRQTPSDGRLLRFWDSAAIPLIRRLEAKRRPPFGQSILAIGRTPETQPSPR